MMAVDLAEIEIDEDKIEITAASRPRRCICECSAKVIRSTEDGMHWAPSGVQPTEMAQVKLLELEDLHCLKFGV